MRIMQVVNVRWFNATAWYGVELARLAMQAGHPSLVLGLPGTPPLEKARALGLPVVPLDLNARSPLAWPRLVHSMTQVLLDFKPDVVNCHRGESFIFWAAIRMRLQQKLRFALVRTRGDQRLPKANWPNLMLHSKIADAVIATNTRMTQYFKDVIKVPEARLHTIYGGVDRQLFRFNPEARQLLRQKYAWPDDAVVIGLLGRFDLVKGQKECLQAVSGLVQQGLPVRLMLIGFETASTLEDVRGFIREANLDERHVVITGKVDDVPGYISALDLGVITSLYSETIARAALEIMSCGVPLVSTNVGVMPDLLDKEALCPPADIPSLSTLLARAVTDLRWRKELTRHQARRMTTLDSPSFLRLTLDVYEKALARARGSTTSGK